MTTTQIDPSSITLSQTAPWASRDECRFNHRLRNTYRDRFAYVAGRRFRITADHLDAMWWIEECDHVGEWDADGYSGWAMRLSDARRMIAEAVTV